MASAATALLPLSSIADYVLVEEQQKHASDMQATGIGPSADPVQSAIDSLSLQNNLASLRQSLRKAEESVLKRAVELLKIDTGLNSPPSLSNFDSCFRPQQYKAQKQKRDDFIQNHLDQYASIHREYEAALSPQLAEQITKLKSFMNAWPLVRLVEAVDQTNITWHTPEALSLAALQKDLKKIRNEELIPLISAVNPILKSISSIEKLANRMFDKVRSISLKLDELCKTSDAARVNKDKEYVFVSLQDPKESISSKSFRHLHQALNELDNPNEEPLPESIELAISETLDTQLKEEFSSIAKRTLALQNQIFEEWIFTPAPTNTSCGWIEQRRNNSFRIVGWD